MQAFNASRAVRAARAAQVASNTLQARCYASKTLGPRHLLSIGDLAPTEFTTLVRNAVSHKQAANSKTIPTSVSRALAGQTVAMMFSKRSTRTRVSTEAAVTLLGGHAMFLGKDDIQLGVSDHIVKREGSY